MRLQGVFCPVTTPFENEQAAPRKLGFNLEKFLTTDLDGYVLFGSTGESPFITVSERIELIKTARGLIPGTRGFIVGTGYETTDETVAFTRRAADLGADYALVVTPNYYKNQMNDASLYGHFSYVADRSPIPVILYNVPPFTGIDLSVTAIERLAAHSNIAGIKDSTADMSKLLKVTDLASDDFAVLLGNAMLYLAGLLSGANGAVLAISNVAPDECAQVYACHCERSYEKATPFFRRLAQIARSVVNPGGIPAIKAALDLRGFYGGPPRKPLQALADDVVEEVRGHLRQAELLNLNMHLINPESSNP